MGISFYFTFWTIAPITDYPRFVYEIVIVVSSLVSILMISRLTSINKNLKADYIKHHKDNNEFVQLANEFISEFKSKYDKAG